MFGLRELERFPQRSRAHPRHDGIFDRGRNIRRTTGFDIVPRNFDYLRLH